MLTVNLLSSFWPHPAFEITLQLRASYKIDLDTFSCSIQKRTGYSGEILKIHCSRKSSSNVWTNANTLIWIIQTWKIRFSVFGCILVGVYCTQPLLRTFHLVEAINNHVIALLQILCTVPGHEIIRSPFCQGTAGSMVHKEKINHYNTQLAYIHVPQIAVKIGCDTSKHLRTKRPIISRS